MAFLFLLYSFKLVVRKFLFVALIWGAFSAILAYYGNTFILDHTKIPFIIDSRNRLFAYAAILLAGLFIGSFVTYLATPAEETPPEMRISGTMAKSPGNVACYREGETEIKIQEFESGEFRVLIIGVNTNDTISCTIPYKSEKPADQSINHLFSSGEFRLKQENNGKLTYLCSGNNIFYIKKTPYLTLRIYGLQKKIR